MKKTILSTLLLGSIFIYANNNFQARLVDVKVFKGDLGKGNLNTCREFLILETYEIFNTDLHGLVISHTINNDNTSLRKREYKQVGTDYIDYPFCVSSRYYKANIKTKFMNARGKESNLIEFKIDTSSLSVQNANKYPHHIKIK